MGKLPRYLASGLHSSQDASDIVANRDWGILTNIDSMVEATQLNYSAPGSWNDADMMMVW